MELNFKSISALTGIAIVFVVLCIVILTTARRSYIVARERKRVAEYRQAAGPRPVPTCSAVSHTGPGSIHLTRRSTGPTFITNVGQQTPVTRTRPQIQKPENPFFPIGLPAW